MGIEKFGLSLFDMVGYLLPGYIVLFTVSIIESTFTKGKLLCLTTIWDSIFLFSVIAYLLGILGNALISFFIDKYIELYWKLKDEIDKAEKKASGIKKFMLKVMHFFKTKAKKLSPALSRMVTDDLIAAYMLPAGTALNSLDRMLLADAYIVASDGCDERNSLVVREGFFKTATFAFLLLSLVSLVSLFVGGLVVQVDAATRISMGMGQTITLSICFILAFLIFNSRRMFFHRMKVDNTNLIFTAKYMQNKRS